MNSDDLVVVKILTITSLFIYKGFINSPLKLIQYRAENLVLFKEIIHFTVFHG